MSERTLTPRNPSVGWEQTYVVPPDEVPLTDDLQRALEQLRVKREQEDRERKAQEGRVGIFPRTEMGSC